MIVTKNNVIGQRQLENGDWILWDSTNNKEVPWDVQAGIGYSIDKYLKGDIIFPKEITMTTKKQIHKVNKPEEPKEENLTVRQRVMKQGDVIKAEAAFVIAHTNEGNDLREQALDVEEMKAENLREFLTPLTRK